MQNLGWVKEEGRGNSNIWKILIVFVAIVVVIAVVLGLIPVYIGCKLKKYPTF